MLVVENLTIFLWLWYQIAYVCGIFSDLAIERIQIAMAAANSLIASSACASLSSRVHCERQECVRGLLTSSTSAREKLIGGRLNTSWRRVSPRKLSIAMAQETSAASGGDTQQWPIPQTIEEAIEQVPIICSVFFKIRSSRGEHEYW